MTMDIKFALSLKSLKDVWWLSIVPILIDEFYLKITFLFLRLSSWLADTSTVYTPDSYLIFKTSKSLSVHSRSFKKSIE